MSGPKGPRAPLLYRALLRLLPGDFRERYGEAMEATFAEARERAGERGRRTVAWLWLREIVDITRTGIRLRRRTRSVTRRRTMGRGRHRAERGGVASWWDDLRYATRSVGRNPGYASFAWIALTLGIGATTAIFSAVESLLLNPLPFENADRMVMLWRPVSGGGLVTPRAEQVDAWRGETDVFEAIEPISGGTFSLTGRGPAVTVDYGGLRPRGFELAGIRPIRGRIFSEEEVRGEGRPVVLLGHTLWITRFGGDPDVVGETVTLDGEPWTVVGVLPAGATFPNPYRTGVDVWVPLPDAAAGSGRMMTVGWLREWVSVESAEARLGDIEAAAVAEGEAASVWKGSLVKATEGVAGGLRDPLRVFMAAVILLLLIACANVANLLLSRSHLRRHETAVRRAVGASRARLVRQLLLESVLLAVGAAAGGGVLAWVGLRLLPRLRPRELDALELVTLDGGVLALAVILSATAGLIFGLAPAWNVSRAKRELEALRTGTRGDPRGSGSRRFRFALIAAEVALSFALLTGTTLVTRSLVELRGQDPGFRIEGLLTVADFELPEWKYGEDDAARAATIQRMTRRIEGLDGVEAVTRATGLPPSTGIILGVPEAEGVPPGEDQEVLFGPRVDDAYFEVMGQRILEGRGFTEEEVAEQAPVYVLGASTARRFFGEESPLGRRFRVGGDQAEWKTVVGVAADVKITGLSSNGERLQLYRPVRPGLAFGAFGVRVRSGSDAAALARSIRSVLSREEPDLSFEGVVPTATRMADTLARERFLTLLLSAFSAVALLLAGIGLYGVVSQVVGQRTREIGIRVSLGAGRGDVRRLVLAGGTRATLVGIVGGLGVAAAGLRLLESRVYGLEEPDPVAFAAAAAVLSVITIAACWLPLRRAVRVDPVDALRTE